MCDGPKKIAEPDTMICRVCGEEFDLTDLTQVFYHESHRPVPVLIGTDGKPIRGQRMKEED